MKKLMSLTFATTLMVLLLTGFPRRAAAASDVFLTINGIPGEHTTAATSYPLAQIISAVWSIFPL
jgi:hypothetical protein